MLENQKDASDKSKEKAVAIDPVIDLVTTGTKEKVLSSMDAHPDVPKAAKLGHMGVLSIVDATVNFATYHKEAKEKYGKEDAIKISLGQTVSSEAVSSVASIAAAAACKAVPIPGVQLACTIAGAVAANYAHDNIEIGDKTLSDHIGNLVKSKEAAETVVATIPTGLPTPEPSPQNTTSLSNSTDTNKANCDSLRDCKDVSTKGCDTSWLSSKKAIKQRYREMHGHGNGHGNNHEQGSGRAGGISNVKDSRGNDVKDSHGGNVQSGGYGPGGRSKL